MQAVSLSFFRFDRTVDRLWAFGQMGLARLPLARVPDIGFRKLFGTGGGESFRPRPNFGTYAVLATWPSEAVARRRIAEAGVFRRYRAHSDAHWTVYMSTVSVRGAWDGQAPFERREGGELGAPLAVLTRASIKPAKARAFWRDAPDVDGQTAREPALLFKMGMGEVPWIRQVTFSIWSDLEAMKTFAYRHPFHARAARHARERDWFSEELFARFSVTGAEGRWNGACPLERREIPQRQADPVPA